MGTSRATDEPPYIGNVLFLFTAFFVSAIATLIVVGIAGVEGVLAYALAIPVFAASFVGLLAFYDRYYLAD